MLPCSRTNLVIALSHVCQDKSSPEGVLVTKRIPVGERVVGVEPKSPLQGKHMAIPVHIAP